MDIWQLIERDHENIGGLIREIPYALNDPGAVGGREQMLSDLMAELDLHAIALDASLYGPLNRENQTRALIEDLHRSHAEFRRQLQQLARYSRRNSAGWLDTFEDVTFLVDQHLHRHVHELVPAAQTLLGPEEVAAATRAFVRAKTNALRTRRRRTVAGACRARSPWLRRSPAWRSDSVIWSGTAAGLAARGRPARSRRGSVSPGRRCARCHGDHRRHRGGAQGGARASGRVAHLDPPRAARGAGERPIAPAAVGMRYARSASARCASCWRCRPSKVSRRPVASSTGNPSALRRATSALLRDVLCTFANMPPQHLDLGFARFHAGDITDL
ncbi:hemerythrin domain-containing protein [Methylobacterium tardum]|uniref:hemerythrin domain-containing protein n=1 Tax=Methylobacterium tardum TaxID=374432 RepID=UPI003613BCDF